MTMTAPPPRMLPPTGVHKGAVVLAALGSELAARVLSHLDESVVESLVREMAKLDHVPARDRDLIVEEFQHQLDQDPGLSVGGSLFARSLLEQALGAQKAGEMFDHLASGGSGAASLEAILRDTGPEQLAALVADEPPQLVALLISQLGVEKAARVLGALPGDLQPGVAARLAQMDTPAPIALEHLERILQEKVRGASSGGGSTEGPKRVADILGRMRRANEETLIASLSEQSPELAEQVNRFRFTFEDLLGLDGRTLQRVLREIDGDTLRLALKGLDEGRQDVIFSNMSERAGARLREDLESTGPTRLSEVEGAQQKIVAIAKALAEKGEVELRSGSQEQTDDGYV